MKDFNIKCINIGDACMLKDKGYMTSERGGKGLLKMFKDFLGTSEYLYFRFSCGENYKYTPTVGV